MFDPLRGAHTGGHAVGYSAGGASFTVDFHGQVPPTLHQRSRLHELEKPRLKKSETPQYRRYYIIGSFARTAGTTNACSMVGRFVPRSLSSISFSLSVFPVS